MPHSGRERVLIVDDEPANLFALAGLLEDEYATYAARSGAEALEEQKRWLETDVSRSLEENDHVERAGIRALAHLAEMRDTDTGIHVERTQCVFDVFEAEFDTIQRLSEAYAP